MTQHCNNCKRSSGIDSLPVVIHELDWWFDEVDELPEGYGGNCYQWLLCPECKREILNTD